MTWDGRTVLWNEVPCHQTAEDLFNYYELMRDVRPVIVVEVGPGGGGTLGFLKQIAGCPVLSVGEGDLAPSLGETVPRVAILDGDVYTKETMAIDLHCYGMMADYMVVCHTNRPDWGSRPALEEWLPLNPKWREVVPRFPTRHTWLERSR